VKYEDIRAQMQLVVQLKKQKRCFCIHVGSRRSSKDYLPEFIHFKYLAHGARLVADEVGNKLPSLIFYQQRIFLKPIHCNNIHRKFVRHNSARRVRVDQLGL
jgi:hypothetical protein